MADWEGKEDGAGNFYSVLGLEKECSNGELRSAYKKLAMRWHPDRCSSFGDSAMEEAKSKFQEIQEAYSVLSDTNRRFLYDLGVYQSDDDEHGMGDFLGEMAAMMRNTEPTKKNERESFEELQDLFVEMFQADVNGRSGARTSNPFPEANVNAANPLSSSSYYCSENAWATQNSLKRDCGDMTSGKQATSAAGPAVAAAASYESPYMFDSSANIFCFGSGGQRSSSSKGGGGNGGGGGRRRGRKQKVSSQHDVSSRESGISAS